VLSELVTEHLGTTGIAQVFPGFKSTGPLGLLKPTARTAASEA
jgi:hypothetical protein